MRTYGKYTKLTSMVMFGGVGMQPQIDKLRRGVDILVATPGRLLDHHQQRTLDLSHVEIFVLDEADRMLDMGFIHDIKKVLAVLPQKKQSLLFSATFSDEIKDLADRLLNQPALIEVARRNQTAENIAQKIHPVGREMKKDLLTHLIKENDWHQVLVFTRMKHGANRLVEHLLKQDISAMAIHGNKSQTARTKALADFKSGDLRVLVATDIAARGIDIDQLPHVVNFELPNVPEDYVHRIGRTGRAGAHGEAVSLVCVDENGFLRDIEKPDQARDPEGDRARLRAASPSERPEPIVLGRMVIGEGAGRGGVRHHANGRGGQAGGHGDRGGGHGSSGQANRGGSQGSRSGSGTPSRHEHGSRPAASQHTAHGGARAPAREPQAQPPRPQGPRPEGRHEGRPVARLTQPKR